jgi:hypothetical protein
MKKAILFFPIAGAIAFSMPVFAQECTALALAFSKGADSMSSRDLATLRRCVDTELRKKLGADPSSRTDDWRPPPRPLPPLHPPISPAPPRLPAPRER